MGKLPGWFDDLLGATQGAHVPVASPVAPSMDQAGKGHPTIPSILPEDFRALQGQQRAPGAGSSLWTLGFRCTPGGCLAGTPTSSRSASLHFPPDGGREGMDWAGAGTACGQAGLSPRRGEACFLRSRRKSCPLCTFPVMGKEEERAEFF